MEMDDFFEESNLIAGLQIFIFVFLVIAGIAFVWIGISNSRIRAVFKANLPNHLEYLRNRAKSQIESQVAATSVTNENEKSQSSILKRQFIDDSKRRKNFLPASLTPYGTKSSISSKDDIIKASSEIQKQITSSDLIMKIDKEEDETENVETSKAPQIRTSDLFRSIQKEGDSLAEEAKKAEKERKRKEREEKEKKLKEIEEKVKKEAEQEEAKSAPASTSTLGTGGFQFNFPAPGSSSSTSSTNSSTAASTTASTTSSTTSTTTPSFTFPSAPSTTSTSLGTGGFSFNFGQKK